MKLPELLQDDMSNPEIRATKAAMKANKDLRMHERYQAILMHLHNVSNKDISKLTGRSLSTVYNYINSYRESGIDGLALGYSPGRPRQLTPEQEQQVYQTVINQTPADVGFPAKMNWTSPIIRKWIEQEFGVVYSDRGARELLYRLELGMHNPPTMVIYNGNQVYLSALVRISGIRNCSRMLRICLPTIV